MAMQPYELSEAAQGLSLSRGVVILEGMSSLYSLCRFRALKAAVELFLLFWLPLPVKDQDALTGIKNL